MKYADGTYETKWEGSSYPYTKNALNATRFEWFTGGEVTRVVRVTIDTNMTKNSFETLDAIQMLGPPTLAE